MTTGMFESSVVEVGTMNSQGGRYRIICAGTGFVIDVCVGIAYLPLLAALKLGASVTCLSAPPSFASPSLSKVR